MSAATPWTADVVITRDAEGTIRCNVPHSVVHHSPSGFEIGYGGSGPADLALNILNAFVPPGRPINWQVDDDSDRDDAPEKCWRGRCSRFAWQQHQDFKWQFIANMSREGGTIPAAEIQRWIAERRPAASAA